MTNSSDFISFCPSLGTNRYFQQNLFTERNQNCFGKKINFRTIRLLLCPIWAPKWLTQSGVVLIRFVHVNGHKKSPGQPGLQKSFSAWGGARQDPEITAKIAIAAKTKTTVPVIQIARFTMRSRLTWTLGITATARNPSSRSIWASVRITGLRNSIK